MQTNSIDTNKKLLAKYKIPFIILLILSSIGGLCTLFSVIASASIGTFLDNGVLENFMEQPLFFSGLNQSFVSLLVFFVADPIKLYEIGILIPIGYSIFITKALIELIPIVFVIIISIIYLHSHKVSARFIKNLQIIFFISCCIYFMAIFGNIVIEVIRDWTPLIMSSTNLYYPIYIVGVIVGVGLRIACMICSTKIKRIITQQEK